MRVCATINWVWASAKQSRASRREGSENSRCSKIKLSFGFRGKVKVKVPDVQQKNELAFEREVKVPDVQNKN